jgi:hypothetical protein
VRHEVAIITVEPASAGLHPLFHQRFPTDTCWIGNDLVRSCRNNVTPPNGGHQTARRDGDYQPQGGRGLGSEKRESLEDAEGDVLQGPCDMAKAGLPKSQSPVVETHTHRYSV